MAGKNQQKVEVLEKFLDTLEGGDYASIKEVAQVFAEVFKSIKTIKEGSDETNSIVKELKSSLKKVISEAKILEEGLDSKISSVSQREFSLEINKLKSLINNLKLQHGQDGAPGAPGKDAVIDYGVLTDKVLKMLPKVPEYKPYNDEELREKIKEILEKFLDMKRNIEYQLYTGVSETRVLELIRTTPGASGSGGSVTGSIQELTSGAINSVNTDFVFATKPTIIVSDGVWYRENKGWIWDSGTLTATMIIPPNDDLYSLI